MSGPIWSRSMVERRRAMLLVRLGAAGPEGASVAELVYGASDFDHIDSAHLIPRPIRLLNDPIDVRRRQTLVARADLYRFRRLGLVEGVADAAEIRPGYPMGGWCTAWRLSGCR